MVAQLGVQETAVPDAVTVKVGNSSNPAAIAGVIANAVYEQRPVTVRAIGASAVNQAVKSCVLASQYVHRTAGHILAFTPAFSKTTSALNPEETSTVMVFSVHCLPGDPP